LEVQGPLSDIRPGERRGAIAAFLTLFGILAGHTLLETARDALFLARLPPSELPWVYLAMAVVAIAISQGPWRAPRWASGRRSLSLLLLTCAVVTFGFWLAGVSRHPWALRALYLWTGILGTLSALQFWMILGELYTVTEAKRIYKLVGIGSLLGAVAGGAAAQVITRNLAPPALVFASAVMLAVTALGPALWLRRPEGASSAAYDTLSHLVQTIRLSAGHPYVKSLAGLVLVSTVTLTLADYVFKSAVVREVPADQLGAFFATFYMALNALALLAQVFALGWLLRAVGLHRTLWILPAFIFVGAAGVALGGGLVLALLLKGADGTLRHSLHRTGTELLFVPLPDGLRARAKPLIDVVGQRGGQALASLLILAEISQGRGNTLIAAAAAALGILWVAWTAEMRGRYLDLFRAALREGSMRGRVDLQALDLGSLETLFAALNSRDDHEVVGAMELLVEEGRGHLIPALILYHPSKEVVLRAFDLFTRSGRTDFVPVADRLLSHPDDDLRAAALRARTVAAPDEDVLRAAFADPSLLVKATALVGLVAGGWVTDEAQKTLDDLLGSPTPEARRVLARALRQQPVPAFEPLLLQLADSADEAVQVEVAHAMGALRSERFLPALLSMLGSHEARAAARAAFLTYEADGLRFLDEALGDGDLPHEVRRHVPRTISRFPPEDAAPILQRHLVREEDGMVRYKILRGLGRVAADHPEVDLDPKVLREAAERTLEAAFRLVHWRGVLLRGVAEDPRRGTPGQELLATLLRDKQVHATERLFRLLGLLHRREDFEKIYRGFRSAEPKVRAGSRELLENLLEPPLRDAVLALMDGGPPVPAAAQAYYRAAPLGYEGLLGLLLDQPGETLRCLAAYHVGELGLLSLRPRLEAFRTEPTGLFLLRVIERALALLGGGSGGERLQFAG
jgi:ATP:ADP antiporter, AAA family